ncbi:SH3 and cysteine-rich domain-containing protein isoform X2 [Anabrus simplex]|uniref:SH3 and cysteine-rich domain-containing protein isoform X2 n=1 Tax=Anabrus simplex TaxID=316456 RepID=UPI0035A31214
MEQSRRYDSLSSQCRAVLGPPDLAHFVRSLPQTTGPQRPALRHNFVPPHPPPPPPDVTDGPGGENVSNETPVTQQPPPPLKNEIVVDRLSSVSARARYDALRKEELELETQIKQLQDSLDTLLRIQQRSLESSLYNKANELQEDISLKRFDLRVAQIHLGAVKAQKELFASKVESAADSARERKMSSSSTGSMKNKWLKAFKSLKTSNPGNGAAPKEGDKKNQMYHAVSTIMSMRKNGKERDGSQPPEGAAHVFQEYTYKKITPCDACSQVLRGHARQGLKCRTCKLNVHADCQDKLGRCQPKSRLLRRQKSTPEIESRIPEPPDEENYLPHPWRATTPTSASPRQGKVHKQIVPATKAVDINGGGTAGSSAGSSVGSLHRRSTQQPQLMLRGASSSLTVGPVPHASSSAPHSPRRQKLNLRMKSLSLDSPESTEHVQRRRHATGTGTDPQSSHSSSSRIQSPSSPVHNRRLLSARNVRMSSVELPDDTEKSLSSASTSPCPSPKPHRLLPTNLYVVLYNFKSRHPDELDLKAGYKVTVIDSSDPDWWKGKCLGRVGFFPSKYVVRLAPGERPLQVTHNLQVSDGDSGLMLLRDQIVIQVGEELDGMVMIRSGDSRQGVCPLKFLQEV